MSIREVKPDVWQVRVYWGIEAARPRFLYQVVHGTRADAIAVERKLIAQKGGQLRLAAYNLTLGEFLEAWLIDYIIPYKSEKTALFYAMHIKNRIIPAIGSVELRKLTPIDIQRFYTITAKSRLDGRQKKVSTSTIRGLHRTLHAALQRAVKLDLIESNPADRVELPQSSGFKPKVFTLEEAGRFLEAAKESKHYNLVLLALLTGLRKGELLSLRWSNVDLDNSVISIAKSKTVSGERMVQLSPYAVEALRDQRRAVKGDVVFPSVVGGVEMEREGLATKVMSQICERAGLPHVRFHDLRHTHATWLAAMDVSARTVADRLGHRDASFTLRTYAHASMTAQKKAAAIVDNMIAGYLPGNTSENP